MSPASPAPPSACPSLPSASLPRRLRAALRCFAPCHPRRTVFVPREAVLHLVGLSCIPPRCLALCPMLPRLTCPRCYFASTHGPPLVLPVPSQPRPCVAIARRHTSGACIAVLHRRHAASCLRHAPLPCASAARHVPLPRTAPRAPSRSPLNPLVLAVALAHSPPRAFAPSGWSFAILAVLARAVSRSALVLALRPHTLAYPLDPARTSGAILHLCTAMSHFPCRHSRA
ncbi:hypothetical protein DENSPDRAFT_885932 [Dentipellis sp. KUC8613]|nr:hypothetical protein DENSPDRAFT_885932 [Dentipellis sp. KUC8613]